MRCKNIGDHKILDALKFVANFLVKVSITSALGRWYTDFTILERMFYKGGATG